MASETVEELYKNAYKLLLETRDQLEKLETKAETSVAFQGKISTNINSLSILTGRLESLIGKLAAAKREHWRIRIKQLSEETKTLRKSIGNFVDQQYKQSKAEEERAQLFERRTRNNNSSNMDNLYKEGQSLERSHILADELEENARNIRENLSNQNAQLQAIQSALLNIAATLGMSKQIMKTIESRQFMDKLILFAGMIITLIIFFSLYFYMKK